MAARALLAAGLVVAAFAFANAANELHVDTYKDDATAAAAHSQLRLQGRSLTQDGSDTVCYEGCLEPPVDDPTAVPLPTLLFSSAAPAQLVDCYAAAISAAMPYFAIVNITSCYGGTSYVLGWALDQTCPLECVPGGLRGTCGGVNKASVFSMGLCLRVDAPCQPGSEPPTAPTSPSPPHVPTPPPSPKPSPPPPRPPPSPATAPDAPEPPSDDPNPPPSPPPPPAFTCRDGTSLWGDELAKIKLSSKSSAAANVVACKAYCLAEPGCKGFYYKTTQWCYLMSHVYGYKQYGTSVQACKLNATN